MAYLTHLTKYPWNTGRMTVKVYCGRLVTITDVEHDISRIKFPDKVCPKCQLCACNAMLSTTHATHATQEDSHNEQHNGGQYG